ncbi:MAG: dihydrofolate reductase family protein, partial [Synechococcales bacterium]|nr:dihydrofolate reductase family protein [Synechococcales bacterium]
MKTTVVLAMSADGKISDRTGAAARFGSPQDQAHLEAQVAQADAVLFGAGTLRAYQTSLSIRTPELLAQRRQAGKPEQPIQI